MQNPNYSIAIIKLYVHDNQLPDQSQHLVIIVCHLKV